MAKDPFRYFRPEARELCDQLARGAHELESSGGGSATVVARLLRIAHTLKGAARVVRQIPIADAAHLIEDTLAPSREGGAVTSGQLGEIARLLGVIRRALDELDSPRDSMPTTAPATEPVIASPIASVRTDLADLDVLLDGIAECRIALDGMRRVLDAGGVAADVERALRRHAEQLARELRQMRETGEQLRLGSAAALFEPLERVAKDAARSVGARVVFEGHCANLRMDAVVLDAVLPALVQLVRNAVAHGIEPPAARVAAGKAAEGRIVLTIERRDRRARFSLHDDGRGVDVRAARAAIARRSGADSVAGRSDDEVLGLLMRGGVSTAPSVDQVAGRGVGLDVVRDVVERLGGTSTMHSPAGAGTTVEIMVPLALASVEVLVVESEGAVATLPVAALRGTQRVDVSDPSVTASGRAIVHDGQVIPFLPLSRVLRDRGHARPRSWTAVVVESGDGRAAIGVDRLVGTASVVLRPLPALALADTVIAGASLDDAGVPVISLEPAGLVAAARRSDHGQEVAPLPRAPILVVDDSMTTRMLEQSILEAAGWDVDLAASGEEGLVAARARAHALMLVDVEMPGIDGFTFVEHVRADPALAHVPVVLVTSRSAPEDRKRGRDVGAQGYVVKSEFDQRDLCALIDRLVSA
jgi:two-component system chemotaxis sensor kinase CheA